MFQVHIRASGRALAAARDKVRDRLGINLFDGASGTEIEGVTIFEVVAGPATLDLTDAEVTKAMDMLVKDIGARAGSGASP